MPKITVGSRIGGIVLKKGYLVLSNGKVFEGKLFGAECETLGELVFTTGMCGYIETLTDPSYCGQIVVQTFPTIGNYGIIEEDFEGEYGVLLPVICPEKNLDASVIEKEEEIMAEQMVKVLTEPEKLAERKAASLKRAEDFSVQAYTDSLLRMI